MKTLKLALCGFFSLLCFGCTKKPYQVIDTTVAPYHTVYRVEAPKDATKAQMVEWSKELEAKAGRKTMVNFYVGGRNPKNMIGSYQEGELYEMRRK